MRAVPLALVVLAGCFGMLAPKVEAPKVQIKRLVEAPLPVTTAPGAIRVIRGRGQLPRGFFYYVDQSAAQPRYKLFAVPQYPTVARAHLVIAGMATEQRMAVYGRQKDALDAEYKRQASALGGNALFETDDGTGIVFAIIVGDGAPAAAAEPASALINDRQRDVTGYKPLGAPTKVDLADAVWELPTQEAHCYAAIIALEPDAALNDDAQSVLYLALESDDGLLGNRSYGGPTEAIENPDKLPIEAPRHGRFVAMRSHSAELGCAKGTARARVRLWTKGNVTSIGAGAMRVAMFEKTISKKALAAKVRESEAAWAQARVDAERQAQADAARAAERERERRDREARADAARGGGGGGGGGSSFFSMSLKNECPRTVKLFIGDKPKYGSGTNTSVSSNSINSYSGNAPQTYWIIDDAEHGLSSYTAHAGSQRVRILPGCTGFAPN